MWAFLDSSAFTPHGFCLLWDSRLIWLHGLSDLLTGLAYFSIPLALIIVVRRRRDLTTGRLFWLFAAFILACGTTHFAAILTLWVPAYWLEGLTKAVTALLSVVTACRLWPMLEAAERSEAQYRLLAENATDIIFELDLCQRLTYISKSCTEFLGYTPEEMLGVPRLALVHPEDRAMVREAYDDVAVGCERREILYRGCHRDGHWIWVEVALRRTRDARGRPRSILGVGRDVSRRKLAEDLIRESESRYRLLAESMSDAVTCLGPDLCRTYVSPSYFQLFGYDPEGLVGKSPERIVHVDDWPSLQEALTKLRDGEEQEALRYRVVRADGRSIWVETHARLMSDGVSMILSMRDITTRKEAEDDLRLANAQLQEAARIDSLTGLANRRRFDEALNLEFKRCMRNELPLSLILIDVDCFKSYNDRYGHQAGDVCLQELGQVARRFARRAGDVAARYGGEELAVVLPDTEAEKAASLAERMRVAISALRMEHVGNPCGVVTASFGVATIYPSQQSGPTADLVKRADQLLYEAKARGRNLVMSDPIRS